MRITNLMLTQLSGDSNDNGDSNEEGSQDQQGGGQGDKDSSNEQKEESNQGGEGQDSQQQTGDDGQSESSEGKQDGQGQDSQQNSQQISGRVKGPGCSSSIKDYLEQESGDESMNTVKDAHSALDELAQDLIKEAQQNCLEDEQMYRPASTRLDEVLTAESGSKRTARTRKKQVKPIVASLVTKMRTKFLMARQDHIQHGVRKGTGLSGRRLVSSFVEMKGGRMPTRPDQRKRKKSVTTLSVSVVLDQSSSMSKSLCKASGNAALAITMAMESLSCPTQVIGFRDGGSDVDRLDGTSADWGTYHRSRSVIIDVFKGWNEKLSMCDDRFSNVRSTGGTPMSDGIHHALVGLNQRNETHRVMLVLTDGYPNNSYVVKRQLRLAKEAGITIVGVGMEYCGCHGVEDLFDTKILCHDITELPKKLVACLDGIVFPKKARKVRLDGDQ